MAIGMYFPVRNLDPSTYASINTRLCDLDEPAGRLYHAAFLVDGGLHVFDVWEDQESFDAFAAHLGPLLAEHGVSGEPVVGPIERIKVGVPTPAV